MEIATSIGQPDFSLNHSVPTRRPESSAQAAMVLVSPLWEISLLVLLFLACSFLVAHLQFSLEYPRSLLILSSDVSGSGWPISLANPSKLSQASQTLMPLPPYLWYAGFLLFLHLSFICAQELCALVLYLPCVLNRLELLSLLRHPHDFVISLFNIEESTTVLFPQEHKQIHALRLPLFGAAFKTVSLPTRLPDKFNAFIVSTIRTTRVGLQGGNLFQRG